MFKSILLKYKFILSFGICFSVQNIEIIIQKNIKTLKNTTQNLTIIRIILSCFHFQVKYKRQSKK